MFIKRSIKVLVIVIVAFAFASVATAYAAANIVPDSKAGDGAGAITGYTVSAIHYVLNSTPTTIDSVTFTLNSAPVAGSTIKIRLVTGGPTWYTCTNVTTAVTCTTTSAPVSTADSLQVVVSD
ncbi:MAG: hypothetical protein NTV38_04070 [Chloroflexi bacterium]|nr:hypothetical protein [Chloroflexota bacterium]